MELPWEWDKTVRDSHRNLALFNFDCASAARKIVVKLSKDVCSDFTDIIVLL